MGWREEIASALGEWIAVEGGVGKQPRWQLVGRAARSGDPGGYVVDLRGSDIGPEQLDSLRLAGAGSDGIETEGFAVSEAVQNGSLLTLRVPEFAEIDDPHLWMLKQPPTFLIEALRDGIAGLGEHPLATALATAMIGGRSAHAIDPPGFHPAQADAYRACLGEGVHLVWGPPGTGKTTVLKRAIGDLIAQGRRVLLVSATNIAVDNALLGVVREKRHGFGDIVRVGPPHLREVADDPSVSLPLMVRARLTEATARRAELEAELVAIGDRAQQLAALEGGLADFDASSYYAALKFVRTPGQDVVTAQARATEAEEKLGQAVQRLQHLAEAMETAHARQRAAEAAKDRWREVDDLSDEITRVREAAGNSEADALLADDYRRSLEVRLKALEAKGAVGRWRQRDTITDLQAELEHARRAATDARVAAQEARSTATAHIARIGARVNALVEAIPLTREQISRLEADTVSLVARIKRAEQQALTLEQEAIRASKTAARARQAQDLAEQAAGRGWPAQHDRAQRLRPSVTADRTRRPELEKQYQLAQEGYERLARNAQGEIIKSAKLVATTLARFRTNRTVLEGPYDVVLVDEAGAATLPEVLLATGKADRAAVLLGDFMQLGPVIPPALGNNDRPDIRRWLHPDVFQHCGIHEPSDAAEHRSCVTLTEQHRFGPAVMRLANDLAYGGVLTGSPQVLRERPDNDPEIVLIDTDGLDELARAHLTGSRKGWWPAGSLIARALVELHREQGEEAGVVTPYGVQAEATLEALRDIEASGRPLAEVGTAHRFQGREFDVVVFDTVEGSGDSRELWMALAHRQPGADAWHRNGIRLFNVAVTRTKTRLYVVAGGARVRNAKPNTALARLAALIGSPGVRVLKAKHLIAPPAAPVPFRGEFGTALAEVLGRHVEVTDVHDETTFYDTFAEEINRAEHSLWLWAPWVAKRLRSLLPALAAAADRGVRIVVFIRDDTDQLQRKPAGQALIADLRAVVHTVIPMNVMHQKIAVFDERTVLLGSLNALSQSWTREVMVAMRGAYFARKLLAHEHAETFARPPKCGRCHGTEIEIRRRKNGTWFWRCYAVTCKTTSSGRSDAWNLDIRLRGGR
ncbi:AAA family ATPase [Streptomyces sp. MBT56]|uniref:AAA domain-containing protein n=1 Tax=unclassified Streptomyces TaxID=2593676 RepID=UPI00190D79DB|nr:MULTISPECIES: AAA domain-containing protein [unclassified Streptomyces]MBK3559982.1 AAA family ATPase [Streptomyces sp. MBT56]MBK3600462.1 AAA family ATPase [Streptomyces sp. MBT54]MBK3613992.1 AAA family ATPase [Streptomyces sp. MBT98]MBK6041954.1 AAA family ATPase [Streptomyces sp. MBT55]